MENNRIRKINMPLKVSSTMLLDRWVVLRCCCYHPRIVRSQKLQENIKREALFAFGEQMFYQINI
jgi:hypothetical protein